MASFTLTDQHMVWFQMRGLTLPKRCPTCRALRRNPDVYEEVKQRDTLETSIDGIERRLSDVAETMRRIAYDFDTLITTIRETRER